MKRIPLTQGREALVDDADYEALSAWRWHFDGRYAVRNTNLADARPRGKVYMHRQLLPVPEVDHINRDKLDNRRANLRSATRSENILNAPKRAGGSGSTFRGVWFDKRPLSKPWAAEVAGKWLGRFATEQEAGEAYSAAAAILRRQDAR